MHKDNGIAFPILLGDREKILKIAAGNGIDLGNMRIIDPKSDTTEEKRKEFGELYFTKMQRKGYNHYEAKKSDDGQDYFDCMMVESAEADAMISGLTKNYPDTIRPA